MVPPCVLQRMYLKRKIQNRYIYFQIFDTNMTFFSSLRYLKRFEETSGGKRWLETVADAVG